ncbi:MAG: hypothetical protein P8Y80_01305 [Acidobacteriota bacterium]|jgi:aspartokinase-like uncharacterized kinase
MSLHTVLKVGGSLARGDGLQDLCREISLLGHRHPLIVVPGGGEFSDLVRQAYSRYDLGETAAHCMALLAMDQYGYLLGRLIEGSSLETGMDAACRTAASGRVAILLPSAAVLDSDCLPHSWQVTSDTIAAWVARETGSPRLVLLKDIDGLMPSLNSPEGIFKEMTAGQLALHAGGVDGYFPEFLALTRLETWVVNGSKPGRIAELLNSGTTVGTRIACNSL